MKAAQRSRKGFTLIELLISISIIGLLVSILVPALSGSRQQAKKTQCLSRLRELYIAHAQYINTEDRFPDLNNLPDDDTYQFNYLIWDGMDFDNNFGPLVRTGGIISDLTVLYCPVQTDIYHSFKTVANPWPVRKGLETRSGYARRYHVSRKNFSQLRTIALLSDVFHLQNVVQSAHKTGVNVAFTDGHAKWVKGPRKLLHNDLGHPFSTMDNPIVKDIWKAMDRAQ